ncbi:protein-L-isoaspartate O-methyltransferase family protein [Algicella marina]|uniref:Protein-L-isoaspartate O-methyltransferase n=1 Tax=Algicella marina TaxID=2683284 RepID=A0A6P1T1P7_9RHOB|nr:protein-L-isoaspartate O-methyltransferase [Algicella marina]QHQ35573.1 protein-L-isoaspartate O-methyltransferase [Algicella marina]
MIDFTSARTAMVDCQIRPSDVTRYPIIAALLDIPRERFVPQAMSSVAYAGEHIGLAPGRVLLDPRVFAKMLDSLAVTPSDLVLDIGSGLGYSTAVIARLAEAVVGVEEDAGMCREAETQLAAIGADNAVITEGPLAAGDPAHGPYDVILVEGGVQEVPAEIVAQLKDGGRIAALFSEGTFGQAKIGRKSGQRVIWKAEFDATAPVLPGFESESRFEF